MTKFDIAIGINLVW